MPKGKPISEDLQWAIVRMARLVKIESISSYTDVSQRQIRRILAFHKATGNVTTAHDRRRRGRRRHLTPEDVAVSFISFHFLKLISR
jgi:hypothetical protein